MTDTTQPPVRVPNVSPGARSGIDHEVIGANAHEAYAVNQSLAGQSAGGVVIPEDLTTVDALLDWAATAETQEEERARAEAILAAEQEKPADKQRKTLIEPLEAYLSGADESDDEEDGEPEAHSEGADAPTGQQDPAVTPSDATVPPADATTPNAPAAGSTPTPA